MSNSANPISKSTSAPCYGHGDPETGSMNGRGESTRRFFKRFSSIKVNYEKENRRTVQSYLSHCDSTHSTANFLKSKTEISQLLSQSLHEDNLDELYVEVFSLLFPPTANSQEKPQPLVAFLRKTFYIDQEKHTQLLEHSSQKQVRERVLHLEVVQARNLPAKDLNGLSDPFCTLYVTTKDNSKRTRVVQETLDPIWHETFKFKIKNLQSDYLKIEVWDHDPEERMRDKLSRIGGVKSPVALGNFLREITHGRHSAQEKMGCFSIPVKEISSETIEKWCPLGDHGTNGEIYLRMGLGVDKSRAEAVTGYRVALQACVIEDIQKGEVMVPFHWETGLDPWAEYLLRQLHTGWGLTPKDILLAKWIAYTRVHAAFPLSGRIFPPLVHQVFDLAGNSEYNTQEVSLILRTASELIAFSIDFVEKLHEFLRCNTTTSQLYYILKTVEVLCKSVDKIRISCSNMMIDRMKHLTATNIISTIHQAIRKSAKLSMWKIVENSEGIKKRGLDGHGEKSSEMDFQKEAEKLLHVGQLLNGDLEKGLTAVDKDIKMILGLDYHHTTYQIYDLEYEKLIRPFVQDFCLLLEKLCRDLPRRSEEEGVKTNQGESLQQIAATNFLNLYLCLKKFSELAPDLGLDSRGWRISGAMHSWFHPGISHLLDLFGRVWMGWMTKAVMRDCCDKDEEDPPIPYPDHAFATITSSAEDAVHIFTQIQSFWTALSWPDPTESTKFAEKLLKELCGYSITYANLVSDNLQLVELSSEPLSPGLGPGSETKNPKEFLISPRLCRSINNIEYVGVFTQEIAVQLNLQQILTELVHNAQEMSFMDRQIDIQRAGIHSVLQRIFTPLATNLQPRLYFLLNLILESPDVNEEGRRINQLFDYVGNNLSICEKNLLPTYFPKIVRVFWEAVLASFHKLIADGLKCNKSHEHFLSMKKLLSTVKNYLETVISLQNQSQLHSPSAGGSLADSSRSSPSRMLSENPKFEEISRVLQLHATSRAEFMGRYFQQRHERDSSGELGLVSIRALYYLHNETLVIEVLNARGLFALEGKCSCDPYAQLMALPTEIYPDVGTFNTKVQKITKYPLFEEIFTLKIRDDQRKKDEGFICISLWDHDFLKKDRLIGEAYLKLSKVGVASSADKRVGETPQQLVPLSLPSKGDVDFLKALLSHRPKDREFMRFVQREEDKSKAHQPRI